MAGTGIGLKGYKSSIGLSRSGETHRTGGQRRRYKNAGQSTWIPPLEVVMALAVRINGNAAHRF